MKRKESVVGVQSDAVGLENALTLQKIKRFLAKAPSDKLSE